MWTKESVARKFIGLDTSYRQADGQTSCRVYLDSAASCLMLEPAFRVAKDFLNHYSNTHSDIHFSAKVTNHCFRQAHESVLSFVSADPKEYESVFVGNGSTGAINKLARMLSEMRKDKPGVFISLMEHHSNDLPHRENHGFYRHIPCQGRGQDVGPICLKSLEKMLALHGNEVNYVAVTAASNVTGVVNPIFDIAEIVHRYGVLLVVDASQYIAHQPLSMSDPKDPSRSIDALVFSGHKLYAPGSPGVMVLRRSLLDDATPSEFGGGMVDSVYTTDYTVVSSGRDREEAGTPNIFGAVLLSATLNILEEIGMEEIAEYEQRLLQHLFELFGRVPGLRVYADNDLTTVKRTATVAFNIDGVDHELLACILNDYFNIAVRNQCFCAHPYVREMILTELWDVNDEVSDEEIEAKKGMVRASFGLYNSIDDASALANALFDIATNVTYYTDQYQLDDSGHYMHKNFSVDPEEYFCVRKSLEDNSDKQKETFAA